MKTKLQKEHDRLYTIDNALEKDVRGVNLKWKKKKETQKWHIEVRQRISSTDRSSDQRKGERSTKIYNSENFPDIKKNFRTTYWNSLWHNWVTDENNQHQHILVKTTGLKESALFI